MNSSVSLNQCSAKWQLMVGWLHASTNACQHDKSAWRLRFKTYSPRKCFSLSPLLSSLSLSLSSFTDSARCSFLSLSPSSRAQANSSMAKSSPPESRPKILIWTAKPIFCNYSHFALELEISLSTQTFQPRPSTSFNSTRRFKRVFRHQKVNGLNAGGLRRTWVVVLSSELKSPITFFCHI